MLEDFLQENSRTFYDPRVIMAEEQKVSYSEM
jgi:hypothetical protein